MKLVFGTFIKFVAVAIMLVAPQAKSEISRVGMVEGIPVYVHVKGPYFTTKNDNDITDREKTFLQWQVSAVAKSFRSAEVKQRAAKLNISMIYIELAERSAYDQAAVAVAQNYESSGNGWTESLVRKSLSSNQLDIVNYFDLNHDNGKQYVLNVSAEQISRAILQYKGNVRQQIGQDLE